MLVDQRTVDENLHLICLPLSNNDRQTNHGSAVAYNDQNDRSMSDELLQASVVRYQRLASSFSLSCFADRCHNSSPVDHQSSADNFVRFAVDTKRRNSDFLAAASDDYCSVDIDSRYFDTFAATVDYAAIVERRHFVSVDYSFVVKKYLPFAARTSEAC